LPSEEPYAIMSRVLSGDVMALFRRLSSALWYVIVLIVIIAMVVAAGQSAFFPEDVELAQWIQTTHSPWLDSIMSFASYLGAWPLAVLWAGGVAGILFLFRQRLEAIFVFLSVLGFGLSEAIKAVVQRPRPSPDLVVVMEPVSGYSFPSGHATFTVVFFGFLLFLVSSIPMFQGAFKRLIQFILWAAIILGAISRVYQGVHWPSDVVGGLIIGLLILLSFIAAYRGFLPRRTYY
jgi:undecaprenyl-diphosphatase